jgi:hypothetical protein
MIEEIVEKYIALRDKKAVYKAEYDVKVAEIEAALTRIENFLLGKMQEQGLKSMPTAAGTPYLSSRVSVTIADWDAYKNFLESQEDPFLFVEHRPNKTAIEEYKAANDDLPPGLNWRESVAVNVKRS